MKFLVFLEYSPGPTDESFRSGFIDRKQDVFWFLSWRQRPRLLSSWIGFDGVGFAPKGAQDDDC